MTASTRREVLGALAAAPLSGPVVARTITQDMPWQPNDAAPPPVLIEDGWHFFTVEEAASIDAIVERLIPTDELGPGGKDAGCTFFIDRQLAGPYGENEGLYTQGPYAEHPLPSQGLQLAMIPRDQYRLGLAALNAYTKEKFDGRRFENLPAEEQTQLLEGLEKGDIKLPDFDGKVFFAAVLKNTMEGFFADPIYGGNRNMAGWKLVGFPGVRYDYRDVIANPNKPYTEPPVSIRGRAAWTEKP